MAKSAEAQQEQYRIQRKREQFWKEKLNEFNENENLEVEYRTRKKPMVKTGRCTFRRTKHKVNPSIVSCVVDSFPIPLPTIVRVKSLERDLEYRVPV